MHIDAPAAPESVPGPDWTALRAEFPTLSRWTYLDTARKAMLPRCVEQAMAEWLQDVYEHAGERAFSMSAIEDTRASVARLIGTSTDTLALIKNTSEGMNILARGMGLKRGDNVVISPLEHENNTFPWRRLADDGVEIRWAEPEPDGCMSLDGYARQIDRRTRVVAAAWVAYGNGSRNAIPALAELCHDAGSRLVVDGIQALGFLDQPVSSLGADALVAGGHKALFSLAGAGLMCVNADWIADLTPPYAAKFSYTSNDRFQANPCWAGDARRFEYGNPNFLGCWVQKRSADWLGSIGLEAIEARIRALSTYLIEQADQSGLVIRTPREWSRRAAIVSFDLPGDAEQTVRELRQRGIIVSAKDGRVRVALHFYNSIEDLDRFLEAVQPS